ncbi:MAG: DinB family protein, partial [Limisphaerales bacterium]
MRGRSLVVLCVLLAPCAALAQSEANPVTAAVRNIVTREAKNLVGAAEEMPADKYGFHPTPEQMTFGKLVSHIVQEDTFLCSKIGNTPAPAMDKVRDTDPKDKLVSALKASTDFCVDVLSKTDDSKLGEELPLFGGHMATRAQAMLNLATDLSDHYSLAATDLRLNGLTPPSAMRG